MGRRLNRVRDGYFEYKRMLNRVQELEAIATKITPVLSDMPKGGSGNQDDKWARLADYKAKVQDKLNQYLLDCEELEEELDCIRSPRIRAAMKSKYIDVMQTDDIARLIETDERYVYKLLARGRKIYEETYKDF